MPRSRADFIGLLVAGVLVASTMSPLHAQDLPSIPRATGPQRQETDRPAKELANRVARGDESPVEPDSRLPKYLHSPVAAAPVATAGAAREQSVALLVPVAAVHDMKAIRQDVGAALERGGVACDVRLALRSVPDRTDVLEALGWCVESRR